MEAGRVYGENPYGGGRWEVTDTTLKSARHAIGGHGSPELVVMETAITKPISEPQIQLATATSQTSTKGAAV